MSRKRTSAPLVFTTTDFFGNLVNLQQDRWVGHIISEHPEMTGYETLVKGVVEAPREVQVSTQEETGLAFISDPGVGPRPEGIRVLVSYADTHYEKGSTSGMITTAYPIDIQKYRRPRLGRTIYKKGGRR